MYFHTDSTSAREFIENVARLATENDQRLRIKVNDDGSLCIKRGEGVWSAPIASTPDPYRDLSDKEVADQYNRSQSNYHMTIV